LQKKNKDSKYAELLTYISKGSTAFNWVSSSNPIQHIHQAKANLDNIVQKYHKDTKTRSEIIVILDCFCNLLKGTELHVLKHFQSGLTWNSSGRDAPSKLHFNSRGTTMSRFFGGTPKLHYEGSKLFCEFQNGEKTIDVDSEKKISILILYCNGAAITVKGTSTSLVIDGCTSTKVILTEGTTSVHVVNSQRVELLTQAVVPSITIERTQGCILSLLDTNSDITTESSSNIQLNLSKSDNDNTIEIPTHVKSKIKQGKAHTTLVLTNQRD